MEEPVACTHYIFVWMHFHAVYSMQKYLCWKSSINIVFFGGVLVTATLHVRCCSLWTIA